MIHPRKKKLRIVFDCAAKYEGTSLNDQVLQGPDLTNKLMGVLQRFRQEAVAVMADIEAMFHQVRVNEDNRDVLRFLWWQDGNYEEGLIEEYRMTVHPFGGTWSPSYANFALLQTAEDNKGEVSGEVLSSVRRNFYVDDLLKSLPDENKAISFVKNLSELLTKGGFHLTKWTSNS